MCNLLLLRLPHAPSPGVTISPTPATVRARSPATVRAPSPAQASAPPTPTSSTATIAKELEQKLFVTETALAPPAAEAAAAAAASQAGRSAAEKAPVVDLAPVSKKGLAHPARPGAGTAGKMIRANHFLVNVTDNNLFHYDVSINPESKSRQTNREVLSELIKIHGKTSLGGKLPAYDGRKSLYNAGSLPFESEEFTVTLVDPEKKDKERAEREYKITIRIAGRTDLYHLQQFLCGRQRDMPQETIQVLDVVLRESPSWNYVTVSRSFFSTTYGHRGDIGEGSECWRDISATSFFKPVTVIQFVQEFLNLRDVSRPLNDRDRVKMVLHNKYAEDKFAHEFGIKVCSDLALVPARVLPPPMLRYHDSGREKTCAPSVGQWNMINKVVASMDWPEITKYRGLVSAQPHRHEIIEDLFSVTKDPKKGTVNGGMIRDLLIAFRRKTGRRPERIIFYRDGVSEGQFSHVLLHEMDALRKACASLEEGYLPPVTFVVVQKIHHTRLFSEAHAKREMTAAGTVVGIMICHNPTEFGYYLCSHAGIQGTSRPTHYHVLYDENHFTADALQSLTNNLCYT
ncbi:hypothetical protein ACQ4PT_002411 [Festuca glaucescens]